MSSHSSHLCLSVTRHLGRSALALLCIVTELQLYFRFKGHHIYERATQAAMKWRKLSLTVDFSKKILIAAMCKVLKIKETTVR